MKQGTVVGTAFHPELTPDSRIHGLAFFENETATVPALEDAQQVD